MENASKALLIAASVLIVILLIAFGMRIFNSTTGTGEQLEQTMQATEISMFNNKFLPYIGQNKSLNDVKSLANVIIAHNSTVKNDNTKIKLSITDNASKVWAFSSNVPNNISTKVSQLIGKKYNIVANYGETGLINGISVQGVVN